MSWHQRFQLTSECCHLSVVWLCVDISVVSLHLCCEIISYIPPAKPDWCSVRDYMQSHSSNKTRYVLDKVRMPDCIKSAFCHDNCSNPSSLATEELFHVRSRPFQTLAASSCIPWVRTVSAAPTMSRRCTYVSSHFVFVVVSAGCLYRGIHVSTIWGQIGSDLI